MKNLYAILFLGVIVMTVGLIGISIYFGIYYIAPLFKDILDLNISASKWLLFSLASLVVSGLFMGFFTLSKSMNRNPSIHLSFAVVFSGISLSIQIYRIILNGFAWIGVEILGNTGDTSIFTTISLLFTIFTLLVFVTNLALIRRELAG
ncbi:MAG TPA: hypothetical protein EYH25_03070 [Thermotoga sp.]|nr:hypothetical protein [Thermotoga sp.]